MGKGTGLGLATVYGMVKQHHGWIEVESEVGVGTTFRIFLPATDQGMPAPPSLPPQVVDVQGGKETILLAEDEMPLLELMRHVLGRYHYNILTASSGTEALQLWDKHQGCIDLLLADVFMPGGMTGRELAAELKKRKPGLKVILTSGFNAAMAGKEWSTGDTTFLSKPYLPDTAAKLIRDTLDANGIARCAG